MILILLQDDNSSSLDTSASTIVYGDPNESDLEDHSEFDGMEQLDENFALYDPDIHCGIYTDDLDSMCLMPKRGCPFHNKQPKKRPDHVEAVEESDTEMEIIDVEEAPIKVIESNVVASQRRRSKSETNQVEEPQPSTSSQRPARKCKKVVPSPVISSSENDDDSDDEVVFKDVSQTYKNEKGLKKIPKFEDWFPVKDISKMSPDEVKTHCQELAAELVYYKKREYNR